MRFLTLSPDQVLPPLVPMRLGMDDEALRELVADVKAHGVRVPITVIPAVGGYRIAAGHRRWLAAQQAGLAEIPAVVKELDEEGEVGEMLAENLHRENPNPLDEARVFAIFQEATGRTIADVAAYVHKSPAYVANRLRILHGPDDVVQALRDGLINLSVALELERCTHDGDRQFLLSHAISGGATATTVSRWVRDQAAQRARAPETAGAPVEVVQIVHHDVLMTPCEWHRGPTPLERSLSFRVCGDCYQELLKVREAAFGTAAAVAPAVPAPTRAPISRFLVYYRAGDPRGPEMVYTVPAIHEEQAVAQFEAAMRFTCVEGGYEVTRVEAVRGGSGGPAAPV